MLSDEVIEKLVERLVNRIEQGNEYVLRQIGKSIKKIGTLSPSKAYQLQQILKFGGDYDKIVKQLSKITELNVKDIYKIFEEVAKKDYEFAKQFYDYKDIKYIPYSNNKSLQRQVNALAKITAENYVNLSKTTVLGFGLLDENGRSIFKTLEKTYDEIIDEAVLNVSQGKESFDSALFRNLKQIGESGLRVVYPSTFIGKNKDGKKVKKNRTMRLDSAMRMNMQGALRDLHNTMQQQFGEEFKSDGVEISVHSHPAPDHQFVQGKQFSLIEFDKFQNDEDAISYDGIEFPAVSEETGHDRRAISQYNCYHYTFAIILGISKPNYSNEELQKIIDDNEKGFEFEDRHYTLYEGTQLQRQLELEIRKAKETQILAKESDNEQLLYNSQTRINQLTHKYKELSDASGLPTKVERMRVEGFSRKSTKALEETANSLYNIGTTEENVNLYFRALKKQEKIRNGEYNLTINVEKQERHIKGTKYYKEGNSYLYMNLEEIQQLVNENAGKGQIPFADSGILKDKEICVVDRIIGVNINENLKKEIETNAFVIHYSKTGVHIVPTDRSENK